ncbi:MAG: FAD binding domain-containing protein [Anaerolineae bacterium]|nr:FAD binding domain-containing protein [Gemmatimonadaceae bacterium]
MKGVIAGLEMREPSSLDEALSAMRNDPSLVPLAGCTDLYVALNFGTLESTRFLNLWSIDELRVIEKSNDALSIGALTTYKSIIQSKLVRKRLPMLISAAREIGGAQIHNRGTLGGNIANGSPAGDTLPVLAAADATVVMRSADAERRVPLTQFYTGYRKSVLRADELIVAVEIPSFSGKQWFRKVGTRAAQAISKVVMAAVRSPRPRIALGSVAPTVIRLPMTEGALEEGAPIQEAQRILMDEISPIDDMRSTEEYRRRVASNLLGRFWAETE